MKRVMLVIFSILHDIFGEYIAVGIGSLYFVLFIVSLVVTYRLMGLAGFLLVIPLAIVLGIPTWKLIRFFDSGKMLWPKK